LQQLSEIQKLLGTGDWPVSFAPSVQFGGDRKRRKLTIRNGNKIYGYD